MRRFWASSDALGFMVVCISTGVPGRQVDHREGDQGDPQSMGIMKSMRLER